MKTLATFFSILFLALAPARAAVVYTANANISVPLDFDGVFLNVYTGATAIVQPGDWDSAPWFNPFFGGCYLGTDTLFNPVITGTDQIVNLLLGATFDGSSNYVAGDSGSSTHIGPGGDQFTLGTPGYIGFKFQPTTGGSTYYGWANVTFSNTGPGMINSYAYEDTGAAITAGFTGSPTAAPEPTRALLLVVGTLVTTLRRRRKGLNH